MRKLFKNRVGLKSFVWPKGKGLWRSSFKGFGFGRQHAIFGHFVFLAVQSLTTSAQT